jgi:hypothetical protein
VLQFLTQLGEMETSPMPSQMLQTLVRLPCSRGLDKVEPSAAPRHRHTSCRMCMIHSVRGGITMVCGWSASNVQGFKTLWGWEAGADADRAAAPTEGPSASRQEVRPEPSLPGLARAVLPQVRVRPAPNSLVSLHRVVRHHAVVSIVWEGRDMVGSHERWPAFLKLTNLHRAIVDRASDRRIVQSVSRHRVCVSHGVPIPTNPTVATTPS